MSLIESTLADLHDGINKLAAHALGGEAVPVGPDGNYVEVIPKYMGSDMAIVALRGPRGGHNGSAVISAPDAALIGRKLLEANAPEGTEPIVHFWSRKHGNCYECGNPAAFWVPMKEVDADNPTNVADEEKRCAVCAANAAVDGEHVVRIEREEF
jgi:hypothetical protein